MPHVDRPVGARADGSMSLLTDMSTDALDPSYAAAAARRAHPGPQDPRKGFPAQLLAGVLLVGLATGVVAAQVRHHAQQVGAGRAQLVADVRNRTAATDLLAAQVDRLRAEVAALRDRSLGDDARGRGVAAQLQALEVATGGLAVAGPGLVVTLDDAHGTRSTTSVRGGQQGEGRVFDSDIQDVVNALWAAGAEAVSVNDQRVTAQTAIRSAGEAILVDLRPLSPPYRVRAIGNVDQIEPVFVDSATARRFQTWISLYGLGFTVARSSEMQLPAAPAPVLRVAHPVLAPPSVPSDRSSPSGGSS